MSSPLTEADHAAKQTAIDQQHLGRMTLGDPSLEREVLAIFARQSALMLARVRGAEPALAAAAAHTLKGSARGIGAWRVARAAEQLERVAAGDRGDAAMGVAIAELDAACQEAVALIDARLRNRLDHRGADPFADRSRAD